MNTLRAALLAATALAIGVTLGAVGERQMGPKTSRFVMLGDGKFIYRSSTGGSMWGDFHNIEGGPVEFFSHDSVIYVPKESSHTTIEFSNFSSSMPAGKGILK